VRVRHEQANLPSGAFLNGRIDLAQAEAVADLIRSRTERAHQASLSQLDGALSEKVSSMRERLIMNLGLLELELDFAEDGYEFAEKKLFADQLKVVIAELNQLISSYSIGKIYRDGVQVALAGAPNVGKSSLLNAFLKEDRAIVTSYPGTTRDIIEESVTIDGLLFVLSDTAGLRVTADPIEQEGVRRAEVRLKSCDILLLMLDRTRPLGNLEVAQSIKLVAEVEARGAKCVVAINKADVDPYSSEPFAELNEILSTHPVLEISAKTLLGFEKLEALLVETTVANLVEKGDSGIMISNLRHFSALQRAKGALELALESTLSGKSSEFIAVDLRSGLDAIGEIVGVVTTEDILNSIFSKFCIGK